MNQEHASNQLKDYVNDHEWAQTATAMVVMGLIQLTVPIHITGKQNLTEATDHVNKKEGGLIVVANHASMIDAIIMKMVSEKLRRPNIATFWANKFAGIDAGLYGEAEKDKLETFKFLGKIGSKLAKLNKIDLIAIPQSIEQSRESIQNVKRILAETQEKYLLNEGVIGFFPEGTRSRSGGKLGPASSTALKKLLDGKQAQEETLILPVSIKNSANVLTLDGKFKPFEPMNIHFGDPINVSDFKNLMNVKRLGYGPAAMYLIAQYLPSEMQGVYEELFA